MDRARTRTGARLAWATVAVTLLVVLAPERPAAADSTTSPYTYLDAIGDTVWPGLPDLSVVQVHNGPQHRVDLRFRIIDERSLLSDIDVVFDLDVVGTSRVREYQVRVDPESNALSVFRTGFVNPACSSHNVDDLGTDRWGRGFSAHFRFRCIGGRRTFRTQAIVQYGSGGTFDSAPDNGYTPYIRPHG